MLRLAVLKTTPVELNQLKKSLQLIQPVKEKLLKIEHVQLNKWANDLKDNSVFIERVNQILCKDAPVVIGKGPVIKEGFHSELDELRLLLFDAKAVLLEIQNREIKNTGITSLKIAFNNIFGYYIELEILIRIKCQAIGLENKR